MENSLARSRPVLNRRFENSPSALEDFFHENIHFPRTDRTLFHVSAGLDCRPLVYFSKGFQSGRGGDLSTPDLVIQTCLGNILDELVKRIQEGTPLYEDQFTRVSLSNFEPLRRQRKIFGFYDLKQRRRAASFRERPVQRYGFDAFFSEVLIEDKRTGYGEKIPLLYLFSENIGTLEALSIEGPVGISTLVATREGTAFGGCKKSIIDHIYRDHSPDCLQSRGFKPSTVVTFQDVTHDWFCRGLQTAGIKRIPSPVDYLPENGRFSSKANIQRLEYPVSAY